MAVKEGDTVTIEYTGSLEDGTVFDSSEKHGKPLEFTIGSKQVIPGFENAVKGMEEGEEKTVTLQPKDAYGERQDALLKQIPKESLPKDEPAAVGKVLMLQLPNGMQYPARITEVRDEDVTIDLNHPLAGKALTFKLKVTGIKSAENSE